MIKKILTVGALLLSTLCYAEKQPQDSTAILLDEVTISAGVSNINKSPLRLKNITSNQIESLSLGRTYPELLRNTPGIFATGESGSYGDAKINIRGFKQENISVLLNGLPISGLTSGSMFWNNWMGLTDATASIQLQKGVGGSMLSDNSVGGTINIITRSPDMKPSIGVGYNYAGYGLSKAYINLNTGESSHGWGVTLIGSYVTGKSYVEATDVRSWAYLLSVSKKVNKRHSFLFTALGSPERHQQRSARLSYREIERYGVGYSKNWGYYNGEVKTISENNYFKPYFTLNHYYNGMFLGKNAVVSNAVYVAVGNGGGIWTESTGKRILNYQRDGHIDWNAVIADNNPAGASNNILSDYRAGHTQIGAKSSVILTLGERLNLDAGIHYQSYRTWENEVITDLLGGSYWLEKGAKKIVGDLVRVNNGRNTNYLTLYALSNYAPLPNLIIKFGASVSGTSTSRWDKYNYSGAEIHSKTAFGGGGSLKGGVLYRMNKANSLYFNAGAYSRAPYPNVYFSSGNNAISHDVKNEKNYLAELGYRFVADRGGAEATLYGAYWKNKTLMSNPYKPLEEDAYKYMITGLDALHYGIEIDAFYRFTSWLKMTGYASIGEWRWKNDVSANIYDKYSGQIASTVNVYSDGLHVGDAPQTQIGANVEFRFLRFRGGELNATADWQFNDRYWADFDPAGRGSVDDRSDPYRIPSYHLLNANIVLTLRATDSFAGDIFFTVNNILNTKYIERSKDGYDHSADTFTGYWGAPRNFIVGVRFRMQQGR